MLDFLQKPKPEKENFWALLIEPEWVNSAVWEMENGKVNVISTSPSTRWESDSEGSNSNLLQAIDVSLSASMQSLPEEVKDPSKTVFGVPSSWIEDGNIKDEHLENLKTICEKLSLVPSGFVVLSEAISHFIKYDEEAPLNGIVLGVSDQNLELSIFNAGTLVGVTNILRSLSVEDDLTEGLTRLGSSATNFPSRVILFNQKEQELEELLETLNNSDWDKIGNSKFMHAPKVEIFDPSKKILAVSLAGGSELGSVDGIVTNDANKRRNYEAVVVEDEPETKTEELPLEEVANIETPDDVTAEDLGFVHETSEPKNGTSEVKQSIVSKMPGLPKMPVFNFKKPNIKLPKFGKLSLGSKPLVIGGSALFTFIVVGLLMWWFLPTASITVYVAPKKLEESISIDLGSGIKNQTIDETVSGEKSKSTTGTKTVGDKAKGSVKIQNGTAFPINLPSGSVLTSSSDLKFVTTQSASVSGALSPSSPGTATISVEASSIGSDYNLGKDEVFKVSNYPKAEVDGTSSEGFTGGSSRQISAVSEEDRKSLLKELTNELLETAKSKLTEKISEEDYLIESSMESEIDEEDYSNKVGDEATSIKLNLSLTVKAVTVAKSDLSTLAKDTLKDKVPSGFVLRDNQLSYDFESSNDGFNVRVTANLLPSMDPTEIAKKIAGKYPNLAESYLGSIPGFVRAEFRVKPLLPGKLGTLPHISKNISVEFSADK